MPLGRGVFSSIPKGGPSATELRLIEGTAGVVMSAASSLSGSPAQHPLTQESLNQLSAATREFGELYTGGASLASSTGARSPKYLLHTIFDSLDNKSDEECLFRVRISGIQCRNLQGRKFSGKSDPFVEFYWDDPDEKAPYATPVIKADLNPNYKGLLIAFEYKAVLAQLAKKSLVVKVFSSRTFHAKSMIGEAKVDLWSVATGPVHHDHHLIGCDNGRVVFNCYMEQCSEWNISVSEVGVMMPAIANELDRPEGHDFQEDASLPLKKFAVSYKCTIGTSESFYIGNQLKHASKRVMSEIQEVSFQSLARLAVLSSRASRPHSLSSSSSANGPPSGGLDDELLADPLVAEDPVGVEWSTSTDYLPAITRYSTFDELMSATLTLEVRGFCCCVALSNCFCCGVMTLCDCTGASIVRRPRSNGDRSGWRLSIAPGQVPCGSSGKISAMTLAFYIL